MKHQALLEMMVLGALSSTSYLFYKLALNDIDPFTVVSLRIGLGGVLLFLILKLNRIALPLPTKHFNLWKRCFILGFFTNGFPFVCFCYSINTIPTSLSALITGMTPVLTIVLASIFLENEHLTFNRIFGVILGLCGFAVLFLPSLLNTFTHSDVGQLDPLGIFLSFVGAASYAVGAIYARKHTQQAPALVVPTLQLLTSLSYLIPLAFFIEGPFIFSEVSLNTWGAILGLSILGTVCAFVLYHRVLTRFGVTTLAMSNYLLPIFGTLLGIVFLNESITLHFLVASLLILLGIATVNGMLPLRARATSVPSS
jgi:drug/metabolite transporter (DMT)-like permease